MLTFRWFAFLASICLTATAARAQVHWTCPDGYEVHAGLNTGFPSAGLRRSFVVDPPSRSSGPMPVWVSLTGTVESTDDNLTVPRSGANARLADRGVMVIGPVRQCAAGDPDYAGERCDGPGRNGWNWTPWNESRQPGAAGERWKTDGGPDARFLEDVVRCVGTRWTLDPNRLFVGGISAGATMTYRALLFDPEFWDGGMAISGEWHVSQDDGTALSFQQGRQSVAARPDKVFQGEVGPYPLPRRMAPMVVISVWGGPDDVWDCGPPLGFCADYRPSTQAASNYFSAQPDVVHVSCSTGDGHRWPRFDTEAFNDWALATLISFPKNGVPAAFRLMPPPPGYSCRVGRYRDHYPARG